MNPFTDESRDARLKLDIKGLADTLRAPESIHFLVMTGKPAGLGVGDFALFSMVDALIDARKVQKDYRAIQWLLDTLFGPLGDRAPARVPTGTSGADRHNGGRKA